MPVAKVLIRTKMGQFMRNDDALKMLAKSKVEVGIPAGSERTDPRAIDNNANLARLMEEGSPLKRIPARPFLRPAIAQPKTRKRITQATSLAIKAIVHDNPEMAKRALVNAGEIALNAVKEWFFKPDLNQWPPLSEATVRRKGHDQPLIETWQMYHALESRVTFNNRTISGPKGRMYKGPGGGK